MKLSILTGLILGLLSLCCAQQNTNETACRVFLDEVNGELLTWRNRYFIADWNYGSNVTSYNEQIKKEEGQLYAEYVKTLFIRAWTFDDTNFSEATRRELAQHKNIRQEVLEPADYQNFQDVLVRMEATFSNAEVCFQWNPDGSGADCHDIEPVVDNQMASSKDYYHLLYIWKEWRNQSGKKMRNDFLTYLRLMKKAAEGNHFNNAAEMWLAPYTYDDPNFRDSVEKLWQEILPIYQEIHAYVREKLRIHYSEQLGADVFPPTGHIPAHILGNMWAQGWSALLPIVEPATTSLPDVSDIMQAEGWTAEKIFQESERFFTSLGLPAMTDSFWEKSYLTKINITGHVQVCHASAWDFFDINQTDYRIKQCTQVRQDDFLTAHHEMGHIEYFMLYAPEKTVFMEGANPGFHEAVGDTIYLSAMTPVHLEKVGLWPATPSVNDPDLQLNFLMGMALRKIAFLPFGYLLDKYRWDLFENETLHDHLNEHYWKLRCDIQGLAPPVTRTEADFDAGAKYHVPTNVPYVRYFVSHVLQFQFHEALCREKGITSNFHECDIYESTEAGDLLKRGLTLGMSENWQDTLETMTGSRVMSAEPLRNYFAPLLDYIRQWNIDNNVAVGWTPGDEANGCPTPRGFAPLEVKTTPAPPVTTTQGAGGVSAAAVTLLMATNL